MLTAPAILTLVVFAACLAAVALQAAFNRADARTSLDLRMSYLVASHKAADHTRKLDKAADAIKPVWHDAPQGLPPVNAELAATLAADVWAVIPAPSEFYQDARGCWRNADTGRFCKSPLVVQAEAAAEAAEYAEYCARRNRGLAWSV